MSKLTPEEKARRFNDPPFRMVILSAYPLKQGGFAVIGRVEGGSVERRDVIILEKEGQRLEAVVDGDFPFHPHKAADTIHLWIKNVVGGNVESGMIVTKRAKSASDFIREEEQRKLLEVPFRMRIKFIGPVEERGIMLSGDVEFGVLIKDQTILVRSEDKVLGATVESFALFYGPHTEFKTITMLYVNDIEHEDLKPGMIITSEDV